MSHKNNKVSTVCTNTEGNLSQWKQNDFYSSHSWRRTLRYDATWITHLSGRLLFTGHGKSNSFHPLTNFPIENWTRLGWEEKRWRLPVTRILKIQYSLYTIHPEPDFYMNKENIESECKLLGRQNFSLAYWRDHQFSQIVKQIFFLFSTIWLRCLSAF